MEQAGSAGQTAPIPAEGIFEALIASAQESGAAGIRRARRRGRRAGARAGAGRRAVRQARGAAHRGRGPAEEEAEVDAREVSTEALQLFLKDIGKVDLLTAAQEIELAKRIERGDHRAKQEMVEATFASSSRSRSGIATRACRSSI